MLGISDSCDDPGASQIFCKRSYDDILFVIICAGYHKIVRTYMEIMERFRIFRIGIDCHNIELRSQLVQGIVVFVYDSNIVIAPDKGICQLVSQFACSGDSNFHIFLSGAVDLWPLTDQLSASSFS